MIVARLALITTKPDSGIVSLADVIVKVETFTPKEDCDKKSCQHGGNTFEQFSACILDCILRKIWLDLKKCF